MCFAFIVPPLPQPVVLPEQPTAPETERVHHGPWDPAQARHRGIEVLSEAAANCVQFKSGGDCDGGAQSKKTST